MIKDQQYYMKLAMKLALKARGATSPNPMVGALIVRDGKIVGKGYHERAGLAHAEVAALEEAGNKARGAVLYVTLEPCRHFGRTPPCVDAIIRAGVKEVVVGMVDPNPANNGKGIEILRQNKIRVSVGVMEEELRKMNEVFIKYITKRLPFVTVKVAESLDGRIATHTGESKWITSDKSRAFAHRIRKEYDAIMVGVNTVLRDNPRLSAWFSKKHPTKVVIDSQLSTPVASNIFSADAQVILVTLPSAAGQETENRKMLSQKARILEVKEKDGQINLTFALKKLAQMGISSIIVEGGGTLIGSLFDEGLVDKVLFFISPKIIGGKDAVGAVMGKGAGRMSNVHRLKDVSFRRIGEDILVEGYVK